MLNEIININFNIYMYKIIILVNLKMIVDRKK
jgi:hypothetical protein